MRFTSGTTAGLIIMILAGTFAISSTVSAKGRYAAYKPNYAIWQSTQGDEDALEAHYSFRYVIDHAPRWETFISYTGMFDFYATTRESSPVINRTSNPAGHLRYKPDWGKGTWVNLSSITGALEHRSNGQVIDVNEKIDDAGATNFGQLKTQQAYAAGDHHYFDGLSRSANYISVEANTYLGPGARSSDNDGFKDNKCLENISCLGFWFSTKFYIDEDSSINWGAVAARSHRIYDYDRYSLIVSDIFRLDNRNSKPFVFFLPVLELSAELTMGDAGLDEASANYNIVLPVIIKQFTFPLFFRWHQGPMNTLADYTTSKNSFGVFLRFWDI